MIRKCILFLIYISVFPFLITGVSAHQHYEDEYISGSERGVEADVAPLENVAGDISQFFSVSSMEGQKQAVTDVVGTQVKQLELSTLNHYQGRLSSIQKLRLYMDKEEIPSAIQGYVATQLRDNGAYSEVKLFPTDVGEDEVGVYADITIKGEYLSHAYKFNFKQAFLLKGFVIYGKIFTTNLFKDATFLKGELPIDGFEMIDNVIKTDKTFQVSDSLEIVGPKGQAYFLNQLVLASNYSEQQGVKRVIISYYDLMKRMWCELEPSVSSYQLEQGQKRQILTIDMPFVQTNHLKLKCEFYDKWHKGIITEINGIGRQATSVETIAANLDHVDTIYPDSSQITFHWLKNEQVPLEDYSIQIFSSSDEGTISKEGAVRHAAEDKIVQVVYSVEDSQGNRALTNPIEILVPAKEEGISHAELSQDGNLFLKNPATGWVAYVEGFECSIHEQYGHTVHNPNARNVGLCLQIDDAEDAKEYWRQIDQLQAAGLPVSILYIRQPWSWFEPTEGQYAWKDAASACYELIKGARERKIQLAFRVLTCSASCGQQATPQFVFEAGAGYKYVDVDAYCGKTNEPYLDHPVFLQKFRQFIQAFAQEFDNEETAFVDAHGHGEWGEMNNAMYISWLSNMNQVVLQLQTIYEDHFHHVLLGGQVLSLKGTETIQNSFNRSTSNFVMRRDAFGSDKYLGPHKEVIRQIRNQGIPLFAENCYHHFQSRDFRWSTVVDFPERGGLNEYGGDDPFYTMNAMMKKVVDDAIELQANTLDLRSLEDCKLFLMYGKSYLDEFSKNGGYRIKLNECSFTNQVADKRQIDINTQWINKGYGIIPNKNKRWNNKVKLSFALLDAQGSVVQQEVISTDQLNVGEFERGHQNSYAYQFPVQNSITAGHYQLAVALVNERQQFTPFIQLDNAGDYTDSGWLVLGDIQIR